MVSSSPLRSNATAGGAHLGPVGWQYRQIEVYYYCSTETQKYKDSVREPEVHSHELRQQVDQASKRVLPEWGLSICMHKVAESRLKFSLRVIAILDAHGLIRVYGLGSIDASYCGGCATPLPLTPTSST